MITTLRCLLGLPIEPATRMTRDAVLAVAREAARSAGISDDLSATSVLRRRGRTLWIVATPTTGSGSTIEIDDATGVAAPPERWGIR